MLLFVKSTPSRCRKLNKKAERKLYANLYIACQSRDGDLDNFFAHKNQTFPESIFKYGKLRKCTAKSDFLQCIESLVKVKYDAPDNLMKSIDGAAFAYILYLISYILYHLYLISLISYILYLILSYPILFYSILFYSILSIHLILSILFYLSYLILSNLSIYLILSYLIASYLMLSFLI